MKLNRNCKKTIKGFTLIELLIGVLILMMFFWTVFHFGSNIYRYAGKVKNTTNIKTDAQRAVAVITRDLKSSAEIKIYPDNSELTIEDQKGNKLYYLMKKGQLIRKSGNTTQPLIKNKLSDLVWIRNGDILSLCLVFSYNNLNSHKTSQVKILHNFQLKEAGN